MPEHSPEHILIVEDEANIASTIKIAIENEAFECTWAASGNDALELIESHPIDLIVLDVGLPDINGFELLKIIRSRHSTPVIFLTARGEEIDRVVGLEIGADDYLTKPFSPRELVARIKAILRRISRPEANTNPSHEQSEFTVLKDQARIDFKNESLDLTLAEFKLLGGMLEQPNRVFTRAQLLEIIWEKQHPSDERTIDTHIKSLRAKLKAVDETSEHINTHRGIGYSLKP